MSKTTNPAPTFDGSAGTPRILHINDYPAGTGGGAEVVLSTTVKLLRMRGLEVETFTSADLPDPRRTPLRYLDNRHARRALAARLESFQPTVVHLHNYYHLLSPGILATLADCKRRRPLRVVMTAHDYHLICPNSGGSWFRWWSNQREIIGSSAAAIGYLLPRKWDHRSCFHSLLKLAQHVWNYRVKKRQRVLDLVICPSRFVQETLAPLELPTIFLPNPTPSACWSEAQRPDLLHFVFAGRIEPEKGLYELLCQWPAADPAHWTIVGDGGDLERCRAICRARGLMDRVHFTGRLPHQETLDQIARAHVLVQPSRFLEVYPLTLIEALAHGTNVLAANRGPLPGILADAKVGFLYELDDADSLAGQLAAIRAQFAAGTLNSFTLGPFLSERSETRYADHLLEVYQVVDSVGISTDAPRRVA